MSLFADEVAVHTFGDFQNFNPHLHIIATDGFFYGNGMFIKDPAPSPHELEDSFTREIFKMLKKEDMITDGSLITVIVARVLYESIICYINTNKTGNPIEI